MKKLLTRLFLASAAILGYCEAAKAEAIWTYTTKADPLAVGPQDPGGGLLLTSQSVKSSETTGGPSGIVATTVVGSVSLGTDTYKNAGYTVDITIYNKSGGSHVFTFEGRFSGSFSTTSGANITHELKDPVTDVYSAIALVSQSFTINGNLYTVTLDPHVIVGNLGSLPASIGGIVNVVSGPDDNGGGDVQTTPEPSTMILSMFGISVLGVGAIRRRLRTPAV